MMGFLHSLTHKVVLSPPSGKISFAAIAKKVDKPGSASSHCLSNDTGSTYRAKIVIAFFPAVAISFDDSELIPYMQSTRVSLL
jgi:hypothetical protein